MFRKLLLLNGFAVIGVAIHHATAFGFQAMFDWTDRYQDVVVPNYDQLGSLSYYILIAVRQLDAYAIPAFLFVSGYFIAQFAARGGTSLGWDQVWPRIRTFLIPFVLWTVVRYILLQRPPENIHEILRPYYYIPLMIQFYLLSPFLIPLARDRWKLLLVVSAFIQLGPETLFWYADGLGISVPWLEQIMNWMPLYFFPRRLFWYSLGLVAAVHGRALMAWLEKNKRVVLWAMITSGVLSIIEYFVVAQFTTKIWVGPNFWGIPRYLYAFTFILTVIAYDQAKFPLSKELADLGSKSLGVYLANIPAIYTIAVLMYYFTPWALGNQLIYQAVLIGTGLAIPLILMEIMSFPRIKWAYRYVFG